GLSCQEFTLPPKRLSLYRDGAFQDVGFVDLAVCDYQFIGARALREVPRRKELFLTQGQPTNIGLASLGGMVHPVRPQEDGGLYLQLGENGRSITAPIAPGLVVSVAIRSHKLMHSGARVPISFTPSILALDGEREIVV